METLLDDHPAVARPMYKAQLIEEGILRAWIVSMGRRSSIERVAGITNMKTKGPDEFTKSRSDKFKAAAKKAGCDEDEARWAERLKRVARQALEEPQPDPRIVVQTKVPKAKPRVEKPD